MTTRAVAERAGLPHGAVSYHFRGKQGLLIEAAMFAFARAIPADDFAALAGVEDLIGLISAEVADRDAIDPVLSRLMIQAVRAGQERGAVFTGAPADAIAALLGAVGDGLLLHALLDPELDVHAALNALRALLAPRPS